MVYPTHAYWGRRLAEIEAEQAAAPEAGPPKGGPRFGRGRMTPWSRFVGVFLPMCGAVRERLSLMRLFWLSPIVGVGSFLVLGIAGCTPREAPHQQGASSAPSSPIADATPPPPSTTHNWQYRDGQEYVYQGELSEDQTKAGQSTGAVQMYRYLGEHDGVFKLQVDGDTATCTNPCQVITVATGGFHVERLAFDPDSLIGAAFTDAFNGQLEVYDPAKHAPAKDAGGAR